MGKDWLYWIGTGTGASSARKRRMPPGEMSEAAAASGGCMRAVFHLFDFPSNHHHNLSDFHSRNCNALRKQVTASASKGLEAPRNSLELNPASVLSSRKEENNLHLPVRIQIKTGRGPKAPDDFSSESGSNSPGIKTPSVVARLMGLDLLPDSNSPRISSASSTSRQQRKFRNFLHTRKSHKAFSQDDISVGTGTAMSLPETPRMSLARRSDFEHHRLSLQINKENIPEESSSSSFSDTARRGRRFRLQPQDDNRSPSHYARQIVKQVKESVSRRVGFDITNTTRHKDLTRRDENLILLKPTTKKSKTTLSEISSKSSNTTKNNSKTTTKSPRVSTSDNIQVHGITNPSNTKPQGIIPLQEQNKDTKKVASTGNHTSSGVKKLPFQATRNKKEEIFVHPTATSKSDRKFKKTDILNISNPTLLQAKKDPSPPLTKLPQKQLSSKQSHSYKQLDKRITVKENVHPERVNGGVAAAEYGNYIQSILNLAGVVDNSTALTSVKWHTPSHLIDPLIFHRIELFHLSAAAPTATARQTAGLSRRCNRKLIFQLVDELLGEIFKPYFNPKPRIISSAGRANRQFPLVEELCRRIDGFPAANCVVLEDIDSLIDKDLREPQSEGDLEEEREAVVREIEEEIVERLVCETVAMVGRAAAGGAEKEWRKSRAAIHVR